MSWIHLEDWVGLTQRVIEDPAATGPFNLSAPAPVTNAEFTAALGRALHRPAVFAVPAFALKIALGEIADVLLTGQRAVPAKADALGYRFRYPRVDEALASAVR
jgi:NAD dependent epimerase/dehydratase family enzyme